MYAFNEFCRTVILTKPDNNVILDLQHNTENLKKQYYSQKMNNIQKG